MVRDLGPQRVENAPIKRDVAAPHLPRAIIAGELAPGEKLSEPVIARRYGASRAPVREAIRHLQERGLVTYVANQGVRVAEPSAAEFLALLDVREATEGMAARLSADNMSDAEVAALENLVVGHRGEIERNPLGAYLQDEPEADFHRRIAHGSGNPHSAPIWRGASSRSASCRFSTPRLTSRGSSARRCRALSISTPTEAGKPMPYLVSSDLPFEPAGLRFRALVERDAIVRMPGAHNGMAALQAKAAGFEAPYLSGAAMTASMGLPDLGIVTVDEVAFFVRQVARSSGLPVLVAILAHHRCTSPESSSSWAVCSARTRLRVDIAPGSLPACGKIDKWLHFKAAH